VLLRLWSNWTPGASPGIAGGSVSHYNPSENYWLAITKEKLTIPYDPACPPTGV